MNLRIAGGFEWHDANISYILILHGASDSVCPRMNAKQMLSSPSAKVKHIISTMKYLEMNDFCIKFLNLSDNLNVILSTLFIYSLKNTHIHMNINILQIQKKFHLMFWKK